MPIFKVQPEWLLGNTPETVNGKVSNGVQGNLDTVRLMSQIARNRSRHPLVRELALRIVQAANVKSQNYYDEAKAIGQYVHRKVRYVRDIKGVETLIDPVTLIDQLRRGEAQGDCDDMSLLIASLLLSIGHQPYFRMVRYRAGMPGFSHIYIVTYEKNYGGEKQRLVLDAILKRHPIGFEVPHAEGEEVKA